MRAAPITQMVINTPTALTHLLPGIRKARQIAIVVITPHQRHIVRHLQAPLIELQYLFIWHEHLHLLGRIAYIGPKKFLLVVNDLLQALKLLLFRLIAFHRTVVDAAHTDGEYIVLRPLHGLKPLNPIPLDGLAIGAVVKGAPLFYIPLADIIPQQRFTMGGAYDDATAVGHRLRPRRLEEGHRPLMHGRPDGIGTQSQKEFEYLTIGLGADLTFRPRLKGLAPWAQAPVLIVQENATIRHTGLLLGGIVAVDGQTGFPFRHHIAPPYPRRYPGYPRELQQAVGHSPTVVAFNDNLSVLDADTKAVGRRPSTCRARPAPLVPPARASYR